MHKLEVDAAALKQIFIGEKTIEGRLGKPEYLKIRVGDHIQFQEVTSQKRQGAYNAPALTTVKQLLYFESFEDMLHSVNFQNVIPNAETVDDVVKTFSKLYATQDEYEYGVVAITFALDQ